MASILTSDSTSGAKVLVEVERLHLAFKTEVYRAGTWRDVFTRLASNPIDYLTSTPDYVHAARDISFSVREGDRVGVIGLNGAGKTSLCRCLAGMYTPTAGQVRIHGKLRAIFEPGIGLVPELTGRENAELLAKLMFPGEPGLRAIVDEALAFSELGEFLEVPYRYYSKGMQSRLCLSLISAKPCDVLVLDEVFDGADLFFREKLAQRVLEMIRASGAVLFVSHSPEQVHEVCNRVLVIHRGELVFDGDTRAGLEYYRKLEPPAQMKV